MNVQLTPLQQAFLALQEAEARTADLEAAHSAPIAVIGLGCRAPGGVRNAETLWRLLMDERDAVGPVPSDRWDHDILFDADPASPGKIAARGAGFLDDVSRFDPEFFGISPREAQLMDPQQRLLLEVCWETLENAGQAPDRLKETATGVYVGAAGSDYAYLQLAGGGTSGLGAHFASGIAHSVLSGRVSYILGLQGPSITIDTACSSSLVAVHLACQALRQGDCRMALAGGVNLILTPQIYIALSQARMLSLDGRCRAFDADAHGFGRGEGCAMLALKRLSDAEQDGDRILAVIRGSAVNQDGPSSGLTAPNGPAQEAVIRAAIGQAGIEPREVGYIEAHGTGTELGDPLEANALGGVFGADRENRPPLLIGSVKSNLGHLEAAAGAIGLIKLVLSVSRGIVPAHLHFKTPSPHIAWDDLPIGVPTKATPWPAGFERRIGGVSSFGFSGTNAHVVVEAHQVETQCADAQLGSWLIPLSAHRRDALTELAAETRDALAPGMCLADIARTLGEGRAHLRHRAVIKADSIESLTRGLDAVARAKAADEIATGEVADRDPPRIAFVFTGQGSQYCGMSAGLYQQVPAFRAAFDRCDEILKPLLGASLHKLVLESTSETELARTGLAQPAIFAVEYALAELLASLGVKPAAVIGHSLGEYVAACVAGAIGLPDALRLVAARGALMQSLPAGGAMAAVFASEARVAEAIAPYRTEVSIAAVNGPAQTVISGAAAAVSAIRDALAAAGVKSQPLNVSHAFHSPLMQPIAAQFEREVARVAFARPRMRIISNVTGCATGPDEMASPAYWLRHLLEPVRFADGLSAIAEMDIDICLEVGPTPALSAFAASVLEGPDAPRFMTTLRKGRDDWRAILDTVGSLHLAGVPIEWRGFDSERVGRPLHLPTAQFKREVYWVSAPVAAPHPVNCHSSGHPLLGARVRSPLADIAQFETIIAAETAPFIADHVVGERTIMPATGFIEMALGAGQRVSGGLPALAGVVIAEPLSLARDEGRCVQTIVRSSAGKPVSFEIVSCAVDDADGAWTRHVHGDYADRSAATGIVSAMPARSTRRITRQDHYDALAARGLTFGASLRGVCRIEAGVRDAIGDIELPQEAGEIDAFTVHPALLDACIQVVSAVVPPSDGVTYLPMEIAHVAFSRKPGRKVRALATLIEAKPSLLRADVIVEDEAGEIGRIQGLALVALREDTGRDLYEIAWRQVSRAETRADWTPPVELLAGGLHGRIADLAREVDLPSYHTTNLAIERMCVEWIVAAFEKLGWRPQRGERVRADTLAEQLGVVPRFRRLMPRLLDILIEAGMLEKRGAELEVSAWPSESAVENETPRAIEGDLRFQITRNCAVVLGEILAGRIDPLERLFPNGSSKLATDLYSTTPEAEAYNRLLAEAVARFAANAPAGRPIRILEVGGGTGGTTNWLMPVVAGCSPSNRVEYVFTDIGPALVERARERFKAYDGMTFETFDLESDAEVNAVAAGAFDIVVAANVIHATADLGRTLSRLRTLLAPGGALFMLEVTGFERWIDLSFGLTDGWWRFTDTQRRAAYPLLDRAEWIDVLSECGFEAAEVGPALETSSEALLVARRPLDDLSVMRVAIAGGGALADELATQLRRSGLCADLLDVEGDKADITEFDSIVYLGFLTSFPVEAVTGEAQVERSGGQIAPLLSLLKRAGASSAAARLWIVTQGATAALAGDTTDPLQATAIGLRRSLAMEHAEWRPSLLDLARGEAPASQLAAVVAELTSPAEDDEIALRGELRLVSRLARLAPAGDAAPFRLASSKSGVLDDLKLEPCERRAPGPGEIEIRVRAMGLNFRDVLNALAMRDDGEPLGGECTGLVTAVGPGVDEFAIGDAVVATAVGAMASHVIADQRWVALRPAGISDAQAAALPLVTMTAHHALREVAQLASGQTVLVHAGAGGVGLAAIGIAKRIGAQIIATAGSEHKRTILRDLGIEHVFSSRTLAFEHEISALTKGRGVDVVLNSLAGEFIGASVRSLAQSGVFLEIGKQAIWSQAQFASVRPSARYHVIDLSITRQVDPAAWGRLFREVVADVDRGACDVPRVQVFPIAQSARAFSFMAQARHVGKIVLEDESAPVIGLSRIDPAGSYLITGGLTGLGLETAGHLVERGARHLVLAGRRTAGSKAQARIAAWRADGVDVMEAQLDVSRAHDLSQLMARIDKSSAPLRGIVHSAGTLADAGVLQQDWSSFARPLHAKVAGAWNLHRVSLDRRLDFFVLYSSMAATLGSAGQTNHAAANAFMDALARHRRDVGLPALSIGWGAWSEIGAAAERGVDKGAAARGIGTISPSRGIAMLDMASSRGPAHVMASPMDWARYLAQAPASVRLLAAELAEARNNAPQRAPEAADDETVDNLARRLADATPATRKSLLTDYVSVTVAKVLGRAAGDAVEPRRPLSELGLDSLLAVELRNRLSSGLSLQRALPATLVFECPTVEALAEYLHRLSTAPASPARDVPERSGVQGVLATVDEMTDEEVEALFQRRTGLG